MAASTVGHSVNIVRRVVVVKMKTRFLPLPFRVSQVRFSHSTSVVKLFNERITKPAFVVLIRTFIYGHRNHSRNGIQAKAIKASSRLR